MKHKGKIFLLDDDDLIVTMLSRALRSSNYEVRYTTEPDTAVNDILSWQPDIVMLDVRMPGRSGLDILEELTKQATNAEIVMLTADDTAGTAVRAMKLGAADYLLKPFDLEEVKIVVDSLLQQKKMKQELEYHREQNSTLFSKEMVGRSAQMMSLREKIERIVQARIATVLITGESGTGKELLARYVHASLHGATRDSYAPFIGVNCAAIPETLLESELFGHERGAFTDARSGKKGVLELADSGTLLLDEIGEMGQGLQSKLLRVLEERTFRRVGGKEEIAVDTTVIATTNRELSQAVDQGSFRLDLYYRLNAFQLILPPLRERTEDIELLARHYLLVFSRKYNQHTVRDFSPETLKCFSGYRWPGNIRELKNVIERIVVLESADIIRPEHLPKELAAPTAAPAGETAVSSEHRFLLPEAGLSLDELEKDLIVQALGRAGNNKALAARLLNISYDSLRYQTKKYGLD